MPESFGLLSWVEIVSQLSERQLWLSLGVAATITAVFFVVMYGITYSWNVPIDLRVYRLGGQAAAQLHDELYSLRADYNLPFTYPPFSALLFAPFGVLPGWLATIIWYFLSALALIRICHLTCEKLGLDVPWWLPTVGALLVAGIDPVLITFYYAQVNIWVTWAVMEDLLKPKEHKWRGILVGIAMGFKLTPGIFLLYLLLTKQWRASLVASLAGAATGILGFILLPKSSWAFWTGVAFDSERVGPRAFPTNQSIIGMTWKFFGEGGNRIVQLVVAAIVVVLSVWAISNLTKLGLELEAILVTAMAGFLISPISWSHHFVWLVPILATIAVWLRKIPKGSLKMTGKVIFAVFITMGYSYAIWMLRGFAGDVHGYSWWQDLIANSYGLTSIVAIGWFGHLAQSQLANCGH